MKRFTRTLRWRTIFTNCICEIYLFQLNRRLVIQLFDITKWLLLFEVAALISFIIAKLINRTERFFSDTNTSRTISILLEPIKTKPKRKNKQDLFVFNICGHSIF